MSVIKDAGVRAPLPPFTEEHEELRESVRRFVSAEIAPRVEEWEQAREFPRDLFERCGELGFLGLKFPKRYGGQGGDLAHEESPVFSAR
jgi:acyl-CoA dehydrogenase